MTLRGLPGLILLAAVLLFAVPSATIYFTDWLWFKELGYQGVFLRTLNAQAVVFTATFVIAFLFLFLNLKVARRALSRPQFVLGTTEDGRPIVIESRMLANLLLPGALIVSFGLALSASNNWLQWLSALNAVPFGDKDVLFGRDVAFYVFQMPVLDMVRQQALVLSVLALGASGFLYLLSGNIVMEPRHGVAFWPRLNLASTARRHLSLLLALLLALMAWGTWLELPRTLITGAVTNVVFGASYTDVYARVPFLRVSLVVMSLASLLSFWQAFAPQRWLLPLAIGAYVVVSTAGGLYASFVQRFVVTPNEQTTEQPYILNNIAATRKSYALDRVEERPLSGDAALSADDIIANAGTIENVRLWDHQPLLQTFGQLQEIRPYYDRVLRTCTAAAEGVGAGAAAGRRGGRARSDAREGGGTHRRADRQSRRAAQSRRPRTAGFPAALRGRAHAGARASVGHDGRRAHEEVHACCRGWSRPCRRRRSSACCR